MKRQNSIKQFSIQFIFIMLLFLSIVVMCIMIINVGKDIYNSINEDREDNYQLRVSLSYIANKIRQSDKENSIKIKDIMGNPSVVINETYEGLNYETWIYYYNNSLYEMFIDSGVEFDLKDGMKIIDVDSFDITKVTENLFKFSVTDKYNKNNAELILSLYSNQ